MSKPSASLQLQLERLNLLYVQNVQGLLALAAFATAYLVIAWPTTERGFLLAWSAMVFASALVRAFMTMLWRKRRDRITSVGQTMKWEHALEAIILFSGFAWGAIGWRMPYETVSVQIVTTVAVVLMAAGAVVAYAASYRMMMLVMAPSFLIWALSLFIAGGPLYVTIGGMLLFMFTLSIMVGRAHNRYIISGMKLNIENLDLTERLESKVYSLEKAQEELRRTEALRREQSEIEASNRAKSVLLANASHEIRTPLSAINGFADMLLQNPSLGDEVRTDLRMILRNGKYLVSLVNDLLDISKIENGQMYIQKSFVSPLGDLQEVADLMRPTIQARGLAFDVEIGRLPSRIYSDSARLREILINLLTNAAKFTDHGRISLKASFDDVTSMLKISVKDTGIGISHEAEKQLFHPFWRGESERVQRVPGSGLGLALSRNLAQLLGGDLRLVRTGENAGSEFELTIDAGSGAQRDFARTSESPAASLIQTAKSASRRLEGRKILVVDDSKDLQVLMKRFLEKQGAHVDVRENGAEALDLLRRSVFDLVLMDIKMPVLDGYSATRAARESGYRRPIVAVTAHASNDDRQRCFQSGFDSYVSKPVDFDHFVDDLSKFLPA
jgi:signal transduction histidine kinase